MDSASHAAHLLLPLGRALAGFAHTELLTDVLSGGARTLVAPIDRAFDGLPWRFDALLSDHRVEERCELFEYYALPSRCEASGPLRTVPTLQRGLITLGCGHVIGPDRVARVLTTLRWRDLLVHVVDACVLPTTLIAHAAGVRAVPAVVSGRARRRAPARTTSRRAASPSPSIRGRAR